MTATAWMDSIDYTHSGLMTSSSRQKGGGVPQEDVASPFGWNAVYDILLRALTLQRPTLHDPMAQAIVYADDLLSISSHLPSLQQQADLVAAFAQIFELDLATGKFRAYEFPYHRVHSKQPATTPLTITIQGKTIQLRQRETLTYIDSQYDLDPANQSQHNHYPPPAGPLPLCGPSTPIPNQQ